jgi:hypothetical protein
MIDFIEYKDRSNVKYVKPERHTENEVHDIRIYCEHPGCKTYIMGKEGYNGMFTAETGHRADLRNDIWICNEHQGLWDHLRKAVFVNKICDLGIEDFKQCAYWKHESGGCTNCDHYVKENEKKMKHTLKEIVKNDAFMTHVCEGKVYYQIHVDETTYQLEIDSNDDEWKSTYIYPRFKAITLMRWIRKGMDTDKFIQLN